MQTLCRVLGDNLDTGDLHALGRGEVCRGIEHRIAVLSIGCSRVADLVEHLGGVLYNHVRSCDLLLGVSVVGETTLCQGEVLVQLCAAELHVHRAVVDRGGVADRTLAEVRVVTGVAAGGSIRPQALRGNETRTVNRERTGAVRPGGDTFAVAATCGLGVPILALTRPAVDRLVNPVTGNGDVVAVDHAFGQNLLGLKILGERAPHADTGLGGGEVNTHLGDASNVELGLPAGVHLERGRLQDVGVEQCVHVEDVIGAVALELGEIENNVAAGLADSDLLGLPVTTLEDGRGDADLLCTVGAVQVHVHGERGNVSFRVVRHTCVQGRGVRGDAVGAVVIQRELVELEVHGCAELRRVTGENTGTGAHELALTVVWLTEQLGLTGQVLVAVDDAADAHVDLVQVRA